MSIPRKHRQIAYAGSGKALKLRLQVISLLVLLLFLIGVPATLFASGILKTKREESQKFIENTLDNTANQLKRDYNNATLYAVELSRNLSLAIEKQLESSSIPVPELKKHPEIIEELLRNQLNYLLETLEKSRCSGVFLILDATINPTLSGSEHSRAGLYLKNMEPNIISATGPNVRYLRGPMPIAYNSKLQVLPQWRMEFDTATFQGFSKAMAAGQTSLPLNRSYYWTDAQPIALGNDPVMLCLLPLIDTTGNTFGVCGVEVSSMLFKLAYSPPQTYFNDIFFLFAPAQDNSMTVNGSFIAGCYCPLPKTEQIIEIHENKLSNRYFLGTEIYAGLHQKISLYPGNSIFQERWNLALLTPEKELVKVIGSQNKRLYLLLIALMTLGVALFVFISTRYVKPVLQVVESDSSRNMDHSFPSSSALLIQFEKNIQSLSIAELAVFELYRKGHTAQEAAKALYLSINTIKTHNKRIYTKLNVSSKKELMLYIQMLEERP